ncbi:MAG TPA: hypothetical protein VMU66_09890 [Gaiellales bacterium]|nr:hypothetical protein [Gaiellales bacterium]
MDLVLGGRHDHDPSRPGMLWACEMLPQTVQIREAANRVGLIDLAAGTFNFAFTAAQGCDNALNIDPATGNLLTSTDVARYVYEQDPTGV